jgi:hypothetical protein
LIEFPAFVMYFTIRALLGKQSLSPKLPELSTFVHVCLCHSI